MATKARKNMMDDLGNNDASELDGIEDSPKKKASKVLSGKSDTKKSAKDKEPTQSSKGKEDRKFKGVIVRMTLARETKNTYKYDLDDDDYIDRKGVASDDAPVVTIYIQKAAFSGGNKPKHINLTIEPTS